MQAYAVFDGGGVKGAALAGCLKAAQESKIEFVGFGGSSAGSIVALLATAGELRGQEVSPPWHLFGQRDWLGNDQGRSELSLIHI